MGSIRVTIILVIRAIPGRDVSCIYTKAFAGGENDRLVAFACLIFDFMTNLHHIFSSPFKRAKGTGRGGATKTTLRKWHVVLRDLEGGDCAAASPLSSRYGFMLSHDISID